MTEETSMFANYPDVVTPNDLRFMLNIGRNTAYNLIRSGQIEVIRIGKKILIPKISVIHFITQNAA